jgi:ribulose kinase
MSVSPELANLFKWFQQLCGGEYFRADTVPSETVYKLLERDAARIPPGSDGVLVLDFWQGNRTPYVDAEARGMIWGLSLGHTPAHIYRAIIEAVCFGTENVFRTFAKHDHRVTDVVASGGALNSDLWMQTHADVSNLPIAVTAVPEAVSLGSAILASVAGGVHRDVATAARSMVHVVRTIEPDPTAHQVYQFFFDKYVASYEVMRDLMHEVVDYVRD